MKSRKIGALAGILGLAVAVNAAAEESAPTILAPAIKQQAQAVPTDQVPPTAGKFWAVQPVNVGMVFQSQELSFAQHSPEVENYHQVRRALEVWVVNPAALGAASFSFQCRSNNGQVRASGNKTASASGMTSFGVSDPIMTIWCKVLADKPVLVFAHLVERRTVGRDLAQIDSALRDVRIQPLTTIKLDAN